MAETLKKAIINKITKSRYDELVAAGTISPQMIREEAWLFTDDQYVSSADKQSWDAKADIWNIPTKTSQLTNNSGFITSSDIPSDVSAFTNDAGYITIQDIPKNVSEFTNDVGYITQAAIPTNVSAFTNDVGYLTREVDPTVPSWAKEPTKPTYTKEEIGLGNVENKSSETIRSEITSNNVTTALGYTPINPTEKGANNGIATLDSTGKVPSSQLPAYVDDVIEYDTRSDFPATGESGKIYIAKDTNLTYRWSGTTYVTIASDLALGETHSTAYYGDLGKIAYDHSQAPHAPANAQANVIESISVNGTTETITNKNVDITVPTNNNQLTNGAGYITQNDIPTNVSAFNNDANYITNANETDPVFSSSPAFSITDNDITNWNAKAETTDIKDGTLTIKQNGTTKGTFTANQDTDVNIDITVPTKVSDITNDLHYITSNNNSIANIIELTYDEYQQLVADDEVDPDTEYHIIDNQSSLGDMETYINYLILEADKRKHPIGSLEFNVSGTNPSTYLGFGIWELWGSGRVPVGVDTTQTEFDTVEKTGGSKTSSTTYTPAGTNTGGSVGSHTLTADESGLPAHNHPACIAVNYSTGGSNFFNFSPNGVTNTQPANGSIITKNNTAQNASQGHTHPFTNPTFTGTQATITESTVQPYITCYMWKRTA